MKRHAAQACLSLPGSMVARSEPANIDLAGLASGSLQVQPAPGGSEARRGVGSAIALPRYAYQAAAPMCGDHGMGVDRPSCTIAAFAPGR